MKLWSQFKFLNKQSSFPFSFWFRLFIKKSWEFSVSLLGDKGTTEKPEYSYYKRWKSGRPRRLEKGFLASLSECIWVYLMLKGIVFEKSWSGFPVVRCDHVGREFPCLQQLSRSWMYHKQWFLFWWSFVDGPIVEWQGHSVSPWYSPKGFLKKPLGVTLKRKPVIYCIVPWGLFLESYRSEFWGWHQRWWLI